jgi:hypothetical protein
MFRDRELRIRLARTHKNEGEAVPTEDTISVDPEQIGKIVQEIVIETVATVGKIIIIKKVLDIVGEVVVTTIKTTR